MNASAASPDKTVFDFSKPEATNVWRVVNDDVMGGISSSRFTWTDGRAVFQGRVSLENNGGFASVRSRPAKQDLAGYAAFVIRVRGDGRRYKFTARTDARFDSVLYQMALTTRKGQWQEIRLPFDKFVPTFRGRVLGDVPPLNPAKVTSVGFLIADKQAGPFQLEVAWIKAVAAPAR